MKYRVIVPVKSLARAKSRLARFLSQSQRETLVLDMLSHVLYVLQTSDQVEQIAVVSADKRVLEQAKIWGAKPVREEQPGHNPALHAAALRALSEGATALLTISADLPLLTKADIHAMIEQAAQFDVVLAPSRDGSGTNALLARPPLAIPYLFGVNSLERHLRAARHRGLRSVLYQSCGLALDIDTIEDVQELSRATERAGSRKPIAISRSVVKSK
jgi:2-phospho-L-lactate guanylyltransferase